MPITVDPTTDIGRVRLLSTDLNETSPLFTDEQIEAFLAMAGENVFLAAALAVERIATSEVLISKKITTQDLQTDGPAVARQLIALGKRLREDAIGDVWAVEILPFEEYPARW
jgi:hypothetical protein